jgi:hypothetical protein
METNNRDLRGILMKSQWKMEGNARSKVDIGD